MKKSLLLFCAVLVLSACSGDDDNSQTNSTALHPPAWTHGTWLFNGGGQSSGLKFTSDDVCSVVNNGANCYKESLALYDGTQATTKVSEDISDTDYKVDITIAGSTITYNIHKVSATQINWVINSSSTIALDKQ